MSDPRSVAGGAPSEVARALVAELARRGLTLAVAESLTGGLVAAAVVDVPGASAVLIGGVVAYATPVKHSLVGVDAALLAERGAVDPQVAEQLADGVRRACAVDGRPADVGIGTTGVAGPDPQDGHEAGEVYVGIASPRGIRSVRLALDGGRAVIRRGAVEAALAAALDEVAALPVT
ncbi:CinA family protein [Agromyces sp. MMS24-K17]|uniref:CinA family protein n=1 Tax=Agromyces sp. MMS24-K17 TaxID=3372850 RepID=UPI003754BCD9